VSRPFTFIDLFIDDDTAVAVNGACLYIWDDNLRVTVFDGADSDGADSDGANLRVTVYGANDSDAVLEAFLFRCLDAVQAARTAESEE
jgi:hypothetical protein